MHRLNVCLSLLLISLSTSALATDSTGAGGTSNGVPTNFTYTPNSYLPTTAPYMYIQDLGTVYFNDEFRRYGSTTVVGADTSASGPGTGYFMATACPSGFYPLIILSTHQIINNSVGSRRVQSPTRVPIETGTATACIADTQLVGGSGVPGGNIPGLNRLGGQSYYRVGYYTPPLIDGTSGANFTWTLFCSTTPVQQYSSVCSGTSFQGSNYPPPVLPNFPKAPFLLESGYVTTSGAYVASTNSVQKCPSGYQPYVRLNLSQVNPYVNGAVATNKWALTSFGACVSGITDMGTFYQINYLNLANYGRSNFSPAYTGETYTTPGMVVNAVRGFSWDLYCYPPTVTRPTIGGCASSQGQNNPNSPYQ